ncbi:MAG TPA: histidine kinase [Acidobacteriaceae bacterium]|jgi:two-component system sensor histidine kinase KdpD|nr:histidine kinase [Acidobacteriaceae bacterium]
MSDEIDNSFPHTVSAEHWLEKVAPEKQKGLFKVFLGYSPGVGKTYSMLSEAIRRHERGEDVVIGVVETHGRIPTAELTEQLETVPRRRIEFRGTTFEEMDVEAIIARTPQVVLIDELAHTNVEGSKHRKRYEDVMGILEAKIDVLSTVNIQHVESVTPVVQSLTGIIVRETIPDWVLLRADEVVMVDLTPEALLTRMRRGDIYPLERVEAALMNFFRRGNLIALREMALQHVARSVDRTLDEYVKKKRLGSQWAVHERVVVCISSNPASQQLIARGARMVEGTGGDLYVVHVDTEHKRSEDQDRRLDGNKRFARNLKAEVVELKGRSVPLAVADFVREKRATQVIFGRSAIHGLKKYLYYWQIQRFLQNTPFVDVHIITQE